MSNTIHVKPREGARVRQPNRNGRVMPAEGDFVSVDDTFYIRLINSGDLVVTDEKAPTPQDETSEHKTAPAQAAPHANKHK